MIINTLAATNSSISYEGAAGTSDLQWSRPSPSSSSRLSLTPTLYTNAPTSCATAGVDSPSSRRVPVKIWDRRLLDILSDSYCSSGASYFDCI
ncbi:hypothetical protein CSPX01_13192 [Colletotrichum filicis]|nr:hypothetical protein CSPX01_13192 [Colletotrichum filicis]